MFIYYKSTLQISLSTFFLKSTICFFCLRGLALLGLYFLLRKLQGVPFQIGVNGDDYLYHHISLHLAQSSDSLSKTLRLFKISWGYALYPYLIGLLYKFIYPHTLIARFFNLILGFLALFPFYCFLKNLGLKEKVIRLSLCFYIFSPSFIYFNSLQLKDSLLILICSILFFVASLLLKAKSILRFLSLSLIYFIISLSFFYIRRQFFFLFVLFYLLFFYSHRRFFRQIFPLSIIVIGSFIGFLTLEKTFLLGFLEEPSRFSEWKIFSVLGEMTPLLTFLLGLFLPFPTFIRLPSRPVNYPVDLLTIPLALEIFFTSIFMVFVIFRKEIRKNTNFKILLIMLLLLYLGLAFSGLITYERMRLLLTLISFVFVSFGMVKLEGIFSKKVFLTYLIFFIFVIFYNILRYWVHLHPF
jgi:hypothetical protein